MKTIIKINNEKCVIRERKNPSKNKPKLYVWNIEKMKYVSSLYETKNKRYMRFDYEGKGYLLDIEKEIVLESEINLDIN